MGKEPLKPINKKGNKCFQYAVKNTLSHKGTGKNPERITKLKYFVNKYNWKGINYPLEKDDWKTFGKINQKIALNALYAKKEKNMY